MDGATIAAILTAVATIIGGVRWLLKVFFKQQQQLDEARKGKFADLEKALSAHSIKITIMINKIEKLEAQVELAKKEICNAKDIILETQKGYRKNEDGFEQVTKALKNFVASQESRFKEIEEKVAQAHGRVVVKR